MVMVHFMYIYFLININLIHLFRFIDYKQPSNQIDSNSLVSNYPCLLLPTSTNIYFIQPQHTYCGIVQFWDLIICFDWLKNFIIFEKAQQVMLTNFSQQIPTQNVWKEEVLQSQTVDFGIQVDLNQNPQTLQNMLLCDQDEECLHFKNNITNEERRKLKKKLNKKRRKEKAAEIQRQARRQIGNIIQEFYEGKAKFEDYKDKIQILVQQIYNNDFRDYLDQLIRMRVNYIQKQIWEFTQSILEQNHFQKSQDHIFYSHMVHKIFDTFLEIEESSEEIQKIINIYLKFAYQKNESKEEIIYNNLAINTFNYMIETDQTLKNLLHICDKKISPNKVEVRKKLQELISLIDNYDDDHQDQYDQNSTNCPQDELQSTGHSEDDEVYEQKRKRRRKIKESQLHCEEQILIRRLNSMTIRQEDRVECRIPQQDLRKWQQKLCRLKK